jgi:hypothetical protein
MIAIYCKLIMLRKKGFKNSQKKEEEGVGEIAQCP